VPSLTLSRTLPHRSFLQQNRHERNAPTRIAPTSD
jgi:hypothetical protein